MSLVGMQQRRQKVRQGAMSWIIVFFLRVIRVTLFISPLVVHPLKK